MAIVTVATPISFKMAGLNIALPDMSLKNRELIYLIGGVDIGLSPLSLHKNGVNYQVPAGKNATILGIIGFDGAGPAYVVQFFQNDAVDSSTTQVNKQQVSSAPTAAEMSVPSIVSGNLSIIPSGKFINHVSPNAGTGFYQMWILEEDN